MSDARILFGFHAVLSRMRQHATSIEEILIDRDRIDARMKDLLNMAESANVRVMQVERSRLDGLAGINGRHQGVLAPDAVSEESEENAADAGGNGYTGSLLGGCTWTTGSRNACRAMPPGCAR